MGKLTRMFGKPPGLIAMRSNVTSKSEEDKERMSSGPYETCSHQGESGRNDEISSKNEK